MDGLKNNLIKFLFLFNLFALVHPVKVSEADGLLSPINNIDNSLDSLIQQLGTIHNPLNNNDNINNNNNVNIPIKASSSTKSKHKGMSAHFNNLNNIRHPSSSLVESEARLEAIKLEREYDSIWTLHKDDEKVAWAADCKPSPDGRPLAALTFDDGPFDRKTAMEVWAPVPSHLDKGLSSTGDPTTNLLDNLKAANVPGTFFIVGQHGIKHPELIERMYREGHSVGGHSWDHRNFHLLDTESQIVDIDRALQLVEAIVGTKPPFTRMPFGYRPDAVMDWQAKHNITEVYWRIDSKDWIDGFRTMNNLDNGFAIWRASGEPWPNPIVLFHDSNPYTMNQISEIVSKFQEVQPGIRFVDMYECLGIPRPAMSTNQAKLDAMMKLGNTYVSSITDSCEAMDWTEPMSFHFALITNPYIADGCSMNILVSFFCIAILLLVMLVFFLSRLTSSAHFIPITHFKSDRNHFVYGFQLFFFFLVAASIVIQALRRYVGVDSYTSFPREDFITWSEILCSAFWLFPVYRAFHDDWHPSKISPYTFVHTFIYSLLRAIRVYLNLTRADVTDSRWFQLDLFVLGYLYLIFGAHFFLHVWDLEVLPPFVDDQTNPSPIFAMIPLCNESEEEIAMVLGLLKRETVPQLQLRSRLRFTIVIDGQWDLSQDTKTVKAVFKLLSIDPSQPPTRVEYGCRVWDIVFNDIPITILIKGDRTVAGKRYSQLLFAHHLSNIIHTSFPAHQHTAFILTFDGDVATDGHSISKLVNLLETNPRAAGVSGYVKVANYGPENWWDPIIAYQNFDYRMCTSEKIVESWLGACTCLPGCFSLLRYGAFKACLPHYAVRPNKNDLLAINELNLGEDRSLTTMLLRKDVDVIYECEAVASTVVPDTLGAFLSQRRRWFNSTVVNDLSLLFVQSPLLRFNNPIRVIGWFLCLLRILTIILSVTVASIAMSFCIETMFGLDEVTACTYVVIYEALFCLIVMNRDTGFLNFFLQFNAGLASTLLTVAAVQGLYAASQEMALMVVAIFYGLYFVLLILYLVVDKDRNGNLSPLLWLYGLFSAVFVCAFTALIIPLYALANLDDETWGTRGAGSISKQLYNGKSDIQLPSYKGTHETHSSIDKADTSKWLPFFYKSPAARYDPEADVDPSVEPPLLSGFSMKLVILFAFFVGHSVLCYIVFLPGIPKRWILAVFFLVILGNFVFRYFLVIIWRACILKPNKPNKYDLNQQEGETERITGFGGEGEKANNYNSNTNDNISNTTDNNNTNGFRVDTDNNQPSSYTRLE